MWTPFNFDMTKTMWTFSTYFCVLPLAKRQTDRQIKQENNENWRTYLNVSELLQWSLAEFRVWPIFHTFFFYIYLFVALLKAIIIICRKCAYCFVLSKFKSVHILTSILCVLIPWWTRKDQRYFQVISRPYSNVLTSNGVKKNPRGNSVKRRADGDPFFFFFFF